MNPDYEPIIDPLLDELLGGSNPPDLTQRILTAFADANRLQPGVVAQHNAAAGPAGKLGAIELDVDTEIAPGSDQLALDSTSPRLLDPLLEEVLGGQRPPNLKDRILAAHMALGQSSDTSASALDSTASQHVAADPGSHEPVIDALLEEVLGTQSPPDLKQPILQAYHADRPIEELHDGVRIAIDTGKVDTARVIPSVAIERAAATTKLKRRRDWRGWILAASVLMLAGLGVAYVVQQSNFDVQTELAQFLGMTPPVLETVQTDADGLPLNASANNSAAEADASLPLSPTDSQIAVHPNLPERKFNPPYVPEDYRSYRPLTFAKAVPQRADSMTNPVDTALIVRNVDEHLKRGWKAAELQPTAEVSDDVWLARTSVALLGRLPNDAELDLVEKGRDRELILDQMMADPKFVSNWASKLTNMLVGSANSKKFNREQLDQFLRRSLASEKPYDQITYELLTAVGSTDHEADDFNGAANFMLAHQDKQHAAMTAKIGQVFLGKQLQCARCHGDQANRIAQQEYWQLAALFAQVQTESRDGVSRVWNASTTDPTLTFDAPDKTRIAASPSLPRFLGGNPNQKMSGRLEEVDLRVELARQLVSSPQFSRATMNRLWDQVYGVGFTQPVDNMGQHNQPSHPALLNGLASAFQESGYDFRAALKWMVMSTSFQREVRSTSDVLASRGDLFSSFPRPLRTHQRIGNTLRQVAQKMKAGGVYDSTLAQQTTEDAANQKVAREQADKATQELNAKLRMGGLSPYQSQLFNRLAEHDVMDDTQRIQHVFLSTLGRSAKRGELKGALEMLQASQQVPTVLREIRWVLLNSEEFALQH